MYLFAERSSLLLLLDDTAPDFTLRRAITGIAERILVVLFEAVGSSQLDCCSGILVRICKPESAVNACWPEHGIKFNTVVTFHVPIFAVGCHLCLPVAYFVGLLLW
jgi:hypothetical protein